MKLMTILGTRPEIIRLSRVIERLDGLGGIEQVLVHTGQNYDYELNEIFFEDLGVRAPDQYLDVSRESLGQAYGDVLSRSEAAMIEHQPDAVLLLGDTNSTIAAIIAKRRHIPIFHMEAGNRSFDSNVPEEVNRRIVDHTSDFNLVYTEHARRNLIAEGFPSRRIHLIGSPMKEVLDHQAQRIDSSSALADLDLTAGGYFLASAHREENVDNPTRLRELLASLRALHAEHDLPVLVSLHPRTKNRMNAMGLTDGDGLIFHKPFGFSDYCRLQRDAACVLSDSGTITEESAILDFPAVSIRDSIERPEGLDTGSIILCGIDAASISLAVETRLGHPRQSSVPFEYLVDDCSNRTVNLIVGLTGRNDFWSGYHPR